MISYYTNILNIGANRQCLKLFTGFIAITNPQLTKQEFDLKALSKKRWKGRFMNCPFHLFLEFNKNQDQIKDGLV